MVVPIVTKPSLCNVEKYTRPQYEIIYDLCAVNILAQPLIGLAPTIASLVKSGGEIGLSGVLSSQATSVVEAYKEFFDDVKVAGEENGWVLITGQRR